MFPPWGWWGSGTKRLVKQWSFRPWRWSELDHTALGQLWTGAWTRWPLHIPSSLNYSVILCSYQIWCLVRANLNKSSFIQLRCTSYYKLVMLIFLLLLNCIFPFEKVRDFLFSCLALKHHGCLWSRLLHMLLLQKITHSLKNSGFSQSFRFIILFDLSETLSISTRSGYSA